MTTLFQLAFSGLALGTIYALVALGFVVIYRSSQIFNFAQGQLLTLGAFSMTSLLAMGLPWMVSLLGSMAITGLIAAIIERTILRPLIGRPIFVTAILTIFLGFLLKAITIIIWGTSPRGMSSPWPKDGTYEFFGISILQNSLWTVVAGIFVLSSYFLMIRYTRMGVAMRATSSDQEAALAVGIPVGRIFGISWMLAGAYAAVGGIFLSMFPRSVEPNLDFIALRAFPALIVGGLDSALGAVIAGLALGVLEVLTQGYINPLLGPFGQNFHSIFPYAVMIAFLIFRPYGLFGDHEVERV